MTRYVIHNHLPARDDIKSGAFYENKRSPTTVSREEEEKLRDEAYRRTGITRVRDKRKR